MTSILILVSKIMVGRDEHDAVELEGVDTIQWSESDPWVAIEIPAADYVSIFQQIRPVRIEGSLSCVDYESVRKVFFETDVQAAAENQYAVSETGGRQKIDYFHVWGLDQKGNPREFNLVGVRIRNIEYPLLSKTEAKPQAFIIHFFAEYIGEE